MNAASPASIPRLGQHQYRQVLATDVGKELARAIEMASKENRALDEVITDFLDKHVSPFAGYNFRTIATHIQSRLSEDGPLTTLMERATVASQIVLTQAIGYEVPVKDWVHHEPLADLAVGDRVAIKRNLTHPANMKRIASSEYDVDSKYIADPAKAADADLGTAAVTERRTDFYGKKLVRLDSGFWYNCADGYQDGSGATIITPV